MGGFACADDVILLPAVAEGDIPDTERKVQTAKRDSSTPSIRYMILSFIYNSYITNPGSIQHALHI